MMINAAATPEPSVKNPSSLALGDTMSVVTPIRKGEKEFTYKANQARFWNIITLEDTCCFTLGIVAASDPLDAIAIWGETSLLGGEDWLDESELDEPLRIAWISLEWNPPVLLWDKATELGIGVGPIEVSDTEVNMALKSTDEDYVLAAIIEQRLAEKYPSHHALPDFGRCRRLIPGYFPEEIQRRHRLARAAWEIENKRSADGIFM